MSFSLLLEIIYAITLAGVIPVLIFENREPRKTVTWLLALLFIPVIGLLFYFVFGMNFRYKRAAKRLNKGTSPEGNPTLQTDSSGDVLPEYKKQVTLLEKMNGTPVLGCNKLDFYSSGAEKFEALFDDINNAQEHIHLLYYILRDDEVGQELKRLLIKKAQEGVEIRIIYDDFGSFNTSKKYFSEMNEYGIRTEAFLPLRFPYIAVKLNYRNHRKIVVIDGKIGYIGGMNISTQYVEGYSWGIWRDMQMRIEGKGVYGLQETFISDWYHIQKKEILQGAKYFPPLPDTKGASMQIVSSGADDPYKSISSGFLTAINNAQKYIYIETPYFIPDDDVLKSLQIAALAGVDVRIILPHRSDSGLVDIVTFSYIDALIISGIKVYFYQPGFLHSKIILVDDYLLTIGSTNMDNRSFEINFETNAFVYDEETALKVKQIFMTDLMDSSEVEPEQWLNRPWWRKRLESLMRLLAPVF